MARRNCRLHAMLLLLAALLATGAAAAGEPGSSSSSAAGLARRLRGSSTTTTTTTSSTTSSSFVRRLLYEYDRTGYAGSPGTSRFMYRLLAGSWLRFETEAGLPSAQRHLCAEARMASACAASSENADERRRQLRRLLR